MQNESINIEELANTIRSNYCINHIKEKTVINLLSAMNRDGELNRKETEQTIDIEEEELFNDIDNVISFLKKLKDDGYTSIRQEWPDYNINNFIGVKSGIETDEQYFERIAEEVSRRYDIIKDQNRKKEDIKQQICDLRNQLRIQENQLKELEE